VKFCNGKVWVAFCSIKYYSKQQAGRHSTCHSLIAQTQLTKKILSSPFTPVEITVKHYNNEPGAIPEICSKKEEQFNQRRI
jgi:hypothetical protein